MHDLSQREYVASLQGVGKLYAPTHLDDVGKVMLDVACGLVDCDHGSYHEFDPAGELGRTCFNDQTVDSRITPIMARYTSLMGRHPILTYYRRRPEAREPRTLSDFMTPDEFHATDLYRDVYQSLEVEHQIMLMVRHRGETARGVMLNRGRTDFSTHDRRCLELLQPHMSRTCLFARTLETLETLVDPAAGPSAAEPLASLGLTRREAQTLFHAMHGRSNSEIGRRLQISPLTVKKHLETVYTKLAIPCRAAAAVVVLREVIERSVRDHAAVA